jgi:hypothetical protein
VSAAVTLSFTCLISEAGTIDVFFETHSANPRHFAFCAWIRAMRVP